MPNLVGCSVQEAIALLESVNLEIGATEYDESDFPEGQVFRQEPAADTQTFAGDAVNIWVSGTPSGTSEMPSLVAKSTLLEDAIVALKEANFARIWVHRITPVSYTHLDVYKRQKQTTWKA